MYVNDAEFAVRLEQAISEHAREGTVVEERVGYRRFASSVERAIVAYQSRKGGK
jgi:hypothetical protein